PQSLLKDRNTKFNLYQSYGVKYYLIANIDKKEIEFYQLIDNRYKQIKDLNLFELANDCLIEVNTSELFEH
ncbi:MAG: Uma2 family endonuclease, partial [Parafilimonas sp.]|nr:Uma2 family endonuclease [Parafilimonas sp.]